MRQDLRAIPFFSELSDEVLAAIEQHCRREHYHKGDLIFAEGDYGDAMFIIESGQVKVFSSDHGTEKVYNYLSPGNFFGETALLTGEPRNASVRVVIDSDLVALTKEGLEELIEKYPIIAVHLSRELGRRLSRQLHTPVQMEEFNLVAVVGASAQHLARRLAEATGEEVFLLDLGGLANAIVDNKSLAQSRVFLARGGDALGPEQLPQRLSALVQEYYWMIVTIPSTQTPLTLKAIELADVTIHFGDKDEDWLKQAAGDGYWRVKDDDRNIARTARRMAQRTLGLALSSGSARGLAHIGVLKVFEEENIPVDMIAATSMGSIIGALYCAGESIDQMIKVAEVMQRQTNFFTGFTMWDIGIPPRSGLLRGNKMTDYFRKLLQDRSFEDLNTPLNVVATDVITGEEVIFDSGPLADAMRASVSIIAVFEPAHVRDRFLVDGGAVNPVPTGVLVNRGINIITASNVIPGLEQRLHRKRQQSVRRAPNVINIVMGAMEIMESEIIKTRARPMDIVIHPDVARFSTLDYDRVHEIIAAGEEAARAQIGMIRQLLAPRPRPRPTN